MKSEAGHVRALQRYGVIRPRKSHRCKNRIRSENYAVLLIIRV
jgi:hypothetical protein